MANRDAPYGLRPAMHLTGGTIRSQKYTIASGLATGIGMGDPVFLAGINDRNIEVGTATKAPFVGVFKGCSFQNTGGDMIYSRHWPASQATLGSVDAVAYVYDDPFIIYRIQGSGTAAATDIGKTADVNDTAFDTVSGQSRMEILTPGTNANLYIYDWVISADLVKTTANAEYLVCLNEHDYRNAGSASFTAQS